MASSNIARLGIVLGVDTAELEVKISKAKETFHGFTKQVQRDSDNAAKDIVALRYATEDYGKTLTKVEQIEREIKAGRYQRAEGSLIEMLRKEAAAYDAKAHAIKNATGAQFKMNEQQKMQLTYQTTDLFTQIASGQNPFIAVIQQGGQLKDAMGGVGNAVKAIGSLFTATRVLAGGFAAAIGAVAIAAYQGKDEVDKLNDALTLTGNYSGVTEKSFFKLAETLSVTTNASLGQTKEALMAVISSGEFTGKSIAAVSQAIITYSKIAGVTATEAAQKLKGGLSGTAEGAKSLNKEMNFLTLEQYKQIEALEKANKRQETAELVAVALNTKLEQQRRELGILEKSWEATTKAASNFWNWMKEIGKPETTDQAIAQIERQIAAAQKALDSANKDNPFYQKQQQGLERLKDEKEYILELERIKGRSIASKDVGNAKAKIDEYDKYKGMLKSKAAEVEKAQIEARFAEAKKGATEIRILELESQKKIEEAAAEMRQKNLAEDGRATAQNLKIYQDKVLVIEAELADKKQQIRTKNMLAGYQEFLKTEEEKTAATKAAEDARDAIRTAAQTSTRNLEIEKERLELKYQMVYASEKEQKLAMISLEYARKRKEIEGSPEKDFLTDQLNKQEALEKLNVTIQDSMQRTQQVFDTVWGNMSSAIDNFVKTGKLNMKDFAVSVIRDLIAIQMKAAAMKFLGMAFGAFTGGGGFMNEAGGMELSGSLGFADGGEPPVGKVSIVGERGPELFIPKTAGTIIPNHDLGKIGGTTNVTNNYINAIDAKSFEERLLGSSNAIWAANQYANKNLATNFGRT